MPTDAPSAEDLRRIRRRHHPWPHLPGVCAACGQVWPCAAARLLDLLDRETAHWRAAEGDLARVSAALDAAECRLTAKDGHTIVVTAAELWASHGRARELYERAQAWAAAWKRAATLHRRQAHGAVRFARGEWEHRRTAEDDLAAAERVVAAARDAEPHVVWREAREALRDALAALDDAREGDDAPEL